MSYFDQFNVKSLERIDLLAKQVVEGFIIGMHKSPFHGFSVEFAEHRLYNSGEPTKNIDWKVYARTDKMFVRKYEEETNLRCQIVIDVSSSMYFPEYQKTDLQHLNKVQFSALAAASLMNLLARQRDAYGLTLFHEEILVHTKPKSSQKHYQLHLSHLDNLITNEQIRKTTSTVDVLHEVSDSIHRRSLVVIFSDMYSREDNLSNLLATMQHLKFNKHEVVLFDVIDHKLELNFEYENRPYIFQDLETGEEIKLMPHEVKEQYIERMKAQKDELKERCRQYGIDYIEADINEGFNKILQSYLIRRQSLVKY